MKFLRFDGFLKLYANGKHNIIEKFQKFTK